MQFTKSCPTENVLEFLDLTLSFDVTSKQILINPLLVNPPLVLLTQCLSHVSLGETSKRS